MKKYIILFLSVCCFLGYLTSATAQVHAGLRSKADELYNQYKYALAATLYEKLTEKETSRLHDLKQLASCYKKMNKYEKATNCYATIIKSPDSKPEDQLQYAKILKATAQYRQAKKLFQHYAQATGKENKVALDIAGCDSAILWRTAHPLRYKVQNVNKVNSPLSQFSVSMRGANIYFAGETDTTTQKIYGWTGNPYLKIFTAQKGKNNSLNNIQILSASLNKQRYHVGPVISNKAGTKLFVTRTHPGRNGAISMEQGRKYNTRAVELYIYTKKDGQWAEAKPFPYNNVQNYSVGHAALSTDEKTLYFISDMPGSIGGLDIWYCQWADSGWSVPQNAGKVVNTKGDEMFPSIAADGRLYYSTNGLAGMGNLDIFTSTGSEADWTIPVNLHYPINSAADDFSFVKDKQSGNGFFSSNRKGGKGGDDIYAFFYIKPPIILALTGITVNKKNRQRLPNVHVTLNDKNHTLKKQQISQSDGSFFFTLKQGKNYRITGTLSGYKPDDTAVSTVGLTQSDTLEVALYLEPLFEKGQIITLDNIYYDFDKSNIRADASITMDSLIQIMKENPTMTIEMGSHTDCRGTDEYNIALSHRRAQSAVHYLIEHGIDKGRMTAKGYGESQLVNGCKDGVPCSAAAHQANRRTTFKIISF